MDPCAIPTLKLDVGIESFILGLGLVNLIQTKATLKGYFTPTDHDPDHVQRIFINRSRNSIRRRLCLISLLVHHFLSKILKIHIRCLEMN